MHALGQAILKVGWSVGRLVGWSVGRLVGWLVPTMKFLNLFMSKSSYVQIAAPLRLVWIILVSLLPSQLDMILPACVFWAKYACEECDTFVQEPKSR
jgi:hypothetical protein